MSFTIQKPYWRQDDLSLRSDSDGENELIETQPVKETQWR
jgi:hypothetical protein